MHTERIPNRWRNSRLLIWLIYFSAFVMLLMGLLVCLAGIGSLMPFRFGNLGQAFMLALLGLGVVAGALKVWRMGRTAARNNASFQPDGLHFFIGAKETEKIAWPDITRVTYQGGNILIHGGEGQLFGFDAYSFFLPSRLGKAIAVRAGKEFQPLGKDE